ncbi:hypothetical protein [Deinococcus hopiensis]|uniref:Uncharacterized protein n=1 Tax=Deinococcus hopiensis KR-140 TaxID=695939 RepID=A0A1W1VJR3_9DEIO|nr:hypothetical protein [Deinococcus hopiensis]SMB93470.1 hypothetical protein SAMN00790413_01998 [Deinococcus hopiensis KR-140]
MSQAARDSARCAIEARFQDNVDRDISGLAAQGCRERGLIAPDGTPAHRLCPGSHAGVTRLIWREFTPDWREVVYVYDGTRTEQTRYLNAKLHLTVALAAAGDEPTPEVRAALLAAHEALHALWRVWAGYQATTTDALAAAVTEFEDVR